MDEPIGFVAEQPAQRAIVGRVPAGLVTTDPEWKYVSLRRLLVYLEHSIDEGTQWAVFEPNGEALWSEVRRTVTDFLDNGRLVVEIGGAGVTGRVRDLPDRPVDRDIGRESGPGPRPLLSMLRDERRHTVPFVLTPVGCLSTLEAQEWSDIGRVAAARAESIDLDLGRHLRARVRTGLTCSYEPEAMTAWSGCSTEPAP